MTPLLTDGARDALSLSQFDNLYQALAQEFQRVYTMSNNLLIRFLVLLDNFDNI